MPFLSLRYGDSFPAVAVTQMHLNARLGIQLKIDGKFRKKTRNAVKLFQKQQQQPPNGVIGFTTWTSLTQITKNLDIVEAIDIFDAGDWEDRYFGRF